MLQVLNTSDISSELPLCVDLDGTLLRIDTLHEAAVAAVFRDLRSLAYMPGWLLKSRAHLKAELAKRWTFDAAQLPYHRELLDFLARKREAGARVILCTAAHRDIAEPIAASLGLFDEVIATENGHNLRGSAKADALCRRFGPKGFVYIGNDASDHPVWEQAAGAILVNASASVRRDAERRHQVLAGFDRAPGAWRAAIRAIRPHQWVKNLICFVPPLAAGDLTNTTSWLGAFLIAAAFCCAASAIYLINDMSDLTADRAHVRKCRRPFASGDLPISAGVLICPTLLLAGVLLGWSSGALVAILIYVISSLSYMWLKTKPIVDVFLLALLYTIRLFGGGEASGHPVSLWLLGFSSFLFLSLALIKRVSELKQLIEANRGREVARRGYYVDDVDILITFGCASAFSSSIVLSLYVQSNAALSFYHRPLILWGWVPLLLFWQCRLWLSTVRGFMHDDPIVYASRDWVSWTVFAALVSVSVFALLPV